MQREQETSPVGYLRRYPAWRSVLATPCNIGERYTAYPRRKLFVFAIEVGWLCDSLGYTCFLQGLWPLSSRMTSTLFSHVIALSFRTMPAFDYQVLEAMRNEPHVIGGVDVRRHAAHMQCLQLRNDIYVLACPL